MAHECAVVCAYLLILGGRRDDGVHEHGHKFGHSIDTGGVGAIWGTEGDGLSAGLCLIQPFAGY